ncbi:hypothetical protein A6R68_08455, partial [Neotoma lepida]
MNSNLKVQVHITVAKDIEVGSWKAIIIFVPVPQLKSFQKIQVETVRKRIRVKLDGSRLLKVHLDKAQKN